uniref:DUF4939 domain-containing protein n=1 Tax=Poecilia latipinna TaxID=48699 RepID=A0A3B3U9E7_9TELE
CILRQEGATERADKLLTLFAEVRANSRAVLKDKNLKVEPDLKTRMELQPERIGPGLNPTEEQVGTTQSAFSDCLLPNPPRFDGDPKKCRGFLMQCTIQFNHSPHRFIHDSAKISYIIAHLSDRALDWAEVKFSSSPDYNCTFSEFITELKQTFNQDTDKKPFRDASAVSHPPTPGPSPASLRQLSPQSGTTYLHPSSSVCFSSENRALGH